MRQARLILEDGTTFCGWSFGYAGAPRSNGGRPSGRGPHSDICVGEVVFNTAMSGYPESLTDPSYAGQILVTTFPLIGNYGVPDTGNGADGLPLFMESDRIHAKALVVADYSETYSHWNAKESLASWLKREQVPGITGIDTRRLTKVLREHGVMMGRIIIDHSPLTIDHSSHCSGTGVEGGRVVGIVAKKMVNGQCSMVNEFRGPVILATGHSARDVYRHLAESGIDIEAKGLAIGVRLEHPAHLIDQIQYHSREGRGKWLPAAEYSMVTQVQGRGVYSFCMCPGGFVVPAASGPEQVVVNGMSPSNRNGRWSNSGMVVEIRPEDYKEFKIDKFKIQNSFPLEGDGGSSLPFAEELDGVFLQEELERQCWLQANRLQTAPAQRMTDFVNGRLSADLNESSYAPGLIASPLHFWLPEFISSRLREAFKLWGKQKHGFLTSEATVIGIETRTSSPVRILRDSETLQHIRVAGLFPCGEGAGYAGGIVSAGVDGERCAEAARSYLEAGL